MHDSVRHERRYTVELYSKNHLINHAPSLLLLGLLRLLALLPLRVARVCGAAWGLLAYLSNDKRRCIARINLMLCFPELSARERRRLLRLHFMVAGQSLFDLAFLAWASPQRLAQKIRVTGMRHYRQALRQGRNVIWLAPHCVDLNVGGGYLAKCKKLFSMVKAQKNPVLNWLLYVGRTRFQGRDDERDHGTRNTAHARTVHVDL